VVSLCILWASCLLLATSVAGNIIEGTIQIEPLQEKREVVFPLFAWSDEQLFTSKGAEIKSTLTQADIEDFLYALLNLRTEIENTKLQVLNVLAEAPEVVVVFVEPELTTQTVSKVGDAYSALDGGLYNNLNAILKRSAATLTVPYVTYSTYSSLLDAPLIHVSEDLKQGSVLVVREGDSSLFGVFRQLSGVQTINLNDFKDYLELHSDLFLNGVADIIVVAFENSDHLKSHDSIIGQISTYVSLETSGKYVGVYTANSPATNDYVWSFPSTEVFIYPDSAAGMEAYFAYLNNNATTNTTNTTTINYFPGALLEAYIVVIPLLIMFFIGLCGLFNLQVPERFETPKIVQKAY